MLILVLSSLAFAGVLYIDVTKHMQVVEVETKCGNIYIAPVEFNPGIKLRVDPPFIDDANVTAMRIAAEKAEAEMRKRYGENWRNVTDPRERWWREFEYNGSRVNALIQISDELSKVFVEELSKGGVIVYDANLVPGRLPGDKKAFGTMLVYIHHKGDVEEMLRIARELSRQYNVSVVIFNYPEIKFRAWCNITAGLLEEEVKRLNLPVWGRPRQGEMSLGGPLTNPTSIYGEAWALLHFYPVKKPTPREWEEIKKYLSDTKLAYTIIFYSEEEKPLFEIVLFDTAPDMGINAIMPWLILLAILAAVAAGVVIVIRLLRR
ncbi:hypothetical protein [Pyrobaculum aerophilum]|uniref:hypothetical protein n=1 Tax=Pyrobaculum aerophilum TaxID=13773 RepID=UPI0011C062A4|nr:hypothetical protein [Pyrobaculum aerophilum]